MKIVVSAFIVSVCIFAGGLGASLLKSGEDAYQTKVIEDPGSQKGHEYQASGSVEPSKPALDGIEHEKSTKESGYGGQGKKSYFSFSREFVVPMMQNGSVDSLVLLNLNLEVADGSTNEFFSIEPKLRDNIMTTLVALSNDGITLINPTRVDSYETIRSVVLSNLQDNISSDIENVLIVDIAKQNL